jgi:hypothetical protein
MLPSLPLALPAHTVAAASLLLVPPHPLLPNAPRLRLASRPPLQPWQMSASRWRLTRVTATGSAGARGSWRWRQVEAAATGLGGSGGGSSGCRVQRTTAGAAGGR